mmetsp:Transcript_27163/g.74483  ORF Transcript_27163/g.74483 Transcript_27163/m.74483 type:complete len:139 (-) Transcript_27163:766-1182(-)
MLRLEIGNGIDPMRFVQRQASRYADRTHSQWKDMKSLHTEFPSKKESSRNLQLPLLRFQQEQNASSSLHDLLTTCRGRIFVCDVSVRKEYAYVRHVPWTMVSEPTETRGSFRISNRSEEHNNIMQKFLDSQPKKKHKR